MVYGICRFPTRAARDGADSSGPSRTWESSGRRKRRRRPAVKRPPRSSFCTPEMFDAFEGRAEMDVGAVRPPAADGCLCGPSVNQPRPPTGALLAADNSLADIRGQPQIDAGHFAGASQSNHLSMTNNGISIHAHAAYQTKSRPGSTMEIMSSMSKESRSRAKC